MPRIAGGMIANENASCTPANFMLSSAVISAALRSRTAKSSRPKKIVPVFGVLLNCIAFRPGNATALATPSVAFAISLTLRTTASVRSSDAPGGSCTPPIRYILSWVGMKPLGTAQNTAPVAPISSA